MEKTELYSVIFKRKSIRNYDLTPLDENMLKEIFEHLKALKPMYDDIKIDLNIISSDDVNRRMMKKAPHYIIVFSESKGGYLANVGFMLQQMDLFLSAKGVGSCWQGIPQPTKEVLRSSDLDFIILIAFGKPKDLLYRSSVSEFKRKPLEQITNVDGADDLLEAARLAPSAGNGQPWFFTGDKTMINAYCVKPNLIRGGIKGLLVKKYIHIDVGIALYHLKLAADYLGKDSVILLDEGAEKNSPKGYEYVGSLKILEKK